MLLIFFYTINQKKLMKKEGNKMQGNSYFFEKMNEFKQKEIEKLSKDWWKYDRTANAITLKVKHENYQNYCCCACR